MDITALLKNIETPEQLDQIAEAMAQYGPPPAQLPTVPGQGQGQGQMPPQAPAQAPAPAPDLGTLLGGGV